MPLSVKPGASGPRHQTGAIDSEVWGSRRKRLAAGSTADSICWAALTRGNRLKSAHLWLATCLLPLSPDKERATGVEPATSSLGSRPQAAKKHRIDGLLSCIGWYSARGRSHRIRSLSAIFDRQLAPGLTPGHRLIRWRVERDGEDANPEKNADVKGGSPTVNRCETPIDRHELCPRWAQ